MVQKNNQLNFFKTYQMECWLLATPLFILIILRLLGFDGLYGQDSYEYLRYTKQIEQFYLTGIHPGDFFWPKGYPLISGLFALVLPTNISLQLVSLLSFSGSVWFVNKTIKLIYPKNVDSTIFILLGLVLSPYMLRAGVTSMSDTLSICCLTGSLYYGLYYSKQHTFKALLLCVFLGVYSIFTRHAAFIPVLIIFISISIFWCKNVKIVHLWALIIPLILILIHFYFEVETADLIKHKWLKEWSFTNFFKTKFNMSDGFQENLFPNFVYAFFPFYHIGFFFINGILFLFSIKELKKYFKHNLIIITLSIIFYALFLAGAPFQNNRFLLLTYPLVLILLYPSFNRLIIFFDKYRLIIGLIIIIQLALFIRVISSNYQLNLTETKIASELTHFQNQTLYSFDIDIAIKGRGLIFNYKNLWVEEYKTFEKGGLVLFNEEKLKEQWKGENPMINWNYLKNNYQLKLIKKLNSGWKLYRIGE